MLDPVWNKPIEESDRALDPLGMNRVTDRLLNDLLSGITTLTRRARYYSFYTWLIGKLSKDPSINTVSDFKRNFYDAERIFMLACLAHEEKSGDHENHKSIFGSDKGRRIWKETGRNIDLNFRYFGNKLGGYGQAYQGSLTNIGLVETTDDALYERPTDIGKLVSREFDKLINKTDFLNFSKKKSIKKGTLLKIGNNICLCRLKDKDSSDREILKSIFFGLSPNFEKNPTIKLRKESLFLILFVIDNLSKYKINITDQYFLDSCYFNEVNDKNEIVDISIPDSINETKIYWKIFRSNDYFSFSLESDESLIQFCKVSGISVSYKELLNMPLIDVINFLSEINGIKNFNQNPVQSSKLFDENSKMNSIFNEHKVTNAIELGLHSDKFNHYEVLGSWSALMLAVYMRFYWMRKDKKWVWLIRHTYGDISSARIIEEIEIHIRNKSFSFENFLDWLIKEYVIKRANEVFLGKYSSESRPKSFFHQEGKFYKQDREYFAGYRNTRFNSVITILEDLGLVDSFGTYYKIKDNAKKLMGVL